MTALPTTRRSRDESGRQRLRSIRWTPPRHGLSEGDQAVLESEVGTLTLPVTISEDLPRGVVYSPKGHWPKRAPQHANVNALNPGRRSDMGASTTVHGVEVTIRPSNDR